MSAASYPIYPYGKWKPGSYKDLETGENRIYGLKNPDGVEGYHSGTDIDMNVGEPVFAIADGDVVFATDKYKSTFGNVVVLRHEFDHKILFSLYGHLSPHLEVRSIQKRTSEWTKVKRGQLLGYIGSYEQNGHYGPHLHFEITKDEPPMDENGNYHWAFFGYGKAKKDLNFKNPTLEEQLQIYGTLERFGGNAIDPVEFMKKHLITPRPLPSKIKTVTWNKTAPGSKDGRPYHWDAVTTRLEFPKNGRAIIRIRASSLGGNKGKDAANLRLLFNGVDLRNLKDDLGITATEFRGSDLKGFTKELYLFVDLKAFEKSIPEAKRGFWEKLWEGKNTVDIEFIADEKPTLESINLYEWDGRTVHLDFFERPDPNGFSRAGIPWKAFVSLGKEVVRASSRVRSASAQMREDTDDDGAKFIVNNVIQKHLDYPDAPRYKNWRASGNQDKGALREVVIEKFKKGRRWNAMEIWVDNQPFLENVTFEF